MDKSNNIRKYKVTVYDYCNEIEGIRFFRHFLAAFVYAMLHENLITSATLIDMKNGKQYY